MKEKLSDSPKAAVSRDVTIEMLVQALAERLSAVDATNVLYVRDLPSAKLTSGAGQWDLPGGSWMMVQLPTRGTAPSVKALVVRRQRKAAPVTKQVQP